MVDEPVVEVSESPTDEPLLDIEFNDTSEISVPPRIIDQVIGQDSAVEIVKKAALQKRHIMLIGEPGTGKSMLGLAMAELLPKEELVDILCLPNPRYPNQPRIATLPAGHGTRKVQMDMEIARKRGNKRFIVSLAILLGIIGYAIIATAPRPDLQPQTLLMAMFVGFFIFFMLNQSRSRTEALVPKLLVDNSNKKRAPFNDATGGHAGALLGDVRHDPFQSFFYTNELILNYSKTLMHKSFSELVDNLLIEEGRTVEKRKERNYEAVMLKTGELKVLSDNQGRLSFVNALSVNRYDYDGELIKITTEDGKSIITTPEHRIAVFEENGAIKYVKAIDITMEDKLLSIDSVILDEDDIINTYPLKHQKQAYLYKEYLEVKEHHPDWGYKRISLSLSQNESKCRWWYNGKHIPIPIQTVNWLKERGLLPLTLSNPKLPIISRIIGSLFGDGGIFTNLNAIFLSSKELDSVKKFGKDLADIFGEDTTHNSRIIEGGEKGHSWCYQNTNRSIIRFFVALGAPIGNKTKINFHIPAWIYSNEHLQDEFFGSYLGGELGVPLVHTKGRFLNTLDVGITADDQTLENRYMFLGAVRDYLGSKGITTTSISKRSIKQNRKYLVRLLISAKYENLMQFTQNVKLNYCKYKTEKLQSTLDEFTTIKYNRYKELIEGNMGAERAMKLLNLSPRALYYVISQVEEKAL
ncbi:MAG: ATP-binding protein [Candidatus Heimdallarchaeaceae archaeon]